MLSGQRIKQAFNIKLFFKKLLKKEKASTKDDIFCADPKEFFIFKFLKKDIKDNKDDILTICDLDQELHNTKLIINTKLKDALSAESPFIKGVNNDITIQEIYGYAKITETDDHMKVDIVYHHKDKPAISIRNLSGDRKIDLYYIHNRLTDYEELLWYKNNNVNIDNKMNKESRSMRKLQLGF